MIHARLNELEGQLQKHNKGTLYKLKTIEKFRDWLRQIDQKAEIIPVNDVARLNNLLISLKGDILTGDELELMEEIVGKNEKVLPTVI